MRFLFMMTVLNYAYAEQRNVQFHLVIIHLQDKIYGQ